MKIFNLSILLLLVTNLINAQSIFLDDYQSLDDNNSLLLEKNIPLENSFVTEINLSQLESDLISVPMEKQHDSDSWGEISIPFPDGSFKTLKIEEAPVFEESLYNMYPEIKTYRVVGKYISGRVTVTPRGLDGLIFADGYSFFIEPLDGNLHVSYKMAKSHTDNMICGVDDEVVNSNSQYDFSGNGTTYLQMPPSNGADLKNYRIAIASSGEFSNERGNNLATINADIATYLGELNALFEKELSMTFTLIANNNDIIFFDPNTDGLDINNRTSSAHTVINATIGESNYDIGHVFHELPSPGPGASTGSGVAGLGVVL